MKKYTLFIGLNDKDSRRQEISTAAAIRTVSAIFYRTTDGATINEAHGLYTHDDGGKVSEKTIRAEILDFTGNAAEAIRAAAQEIKTALNQESIAVQVEEVNAFLI